MNKKVMFVFLFSICICADEVYNKNKAANRLYNQGKYEEALKIYEDALLESPGNKRLSMNRGSTHYRMEEFDKAEESYKNALTVEDKKARADLLYNMGNLYNMQGDQLAAAGNPQAMDKFKAARDSYIKALDLRSHDHDAKWNLQLTQLKIKEFKKQQQQQKNKNCKDKQNQDQKGQDQKQKSDKDNKKDQQENKESQNQDDKKKQEERKRQQDKKGDKKEQQKPEPKPQKTEKDIEKQEALRLLQQYADDADELNKPKKQMRAVKGKKPEKDW